MNNKEEIKNYARKLRSQGKTYSEIKSVVDIDIPKSTLSNWCKDVDLPKEYTDRVKKIMLFNVNKARAIALAVNKIKREKYLANIYNQNNHLRDILKDKNIAKIALVVLYLGEGAKSGRGSIMLGNSDPAIIKLFLKLLRQVYDIDESKFRCTVQCRADQNTKQLEVFWSNVTKIPKSQFYRSKIDPRTIGKKSKKVDYKGVCRVDYFSGDIYNELMIISEILSK